jgi:two-component system sensor histidine kinase/response regulator
LSPSSPSRLPAAKPKWQALLQSDAAAWLVLLIALLLTALAWFNARHRVQQSGNDRFVSAASDVQQAIVDRIHAYELVLRSASGLFAASDEVGRTDWRQFVLAQQLEQHYPGIQGLGYSVLFNAADKAAHERQIRAEGFADYAVKPTGERARYSAIIYLEPFNWRNQRAFGFDMYSEPVRRQAMDLAIDSGQTALSGKVQLEQETKTDVQPGFLMYVPVYARGQMLNSVDDKRQHLRGLVYAPFRSRDLFGNLIPPGALPLHFAIYDGDTAQPERLLFDNTLPGRWQPAWTRQVKLAVPGRNWTLHVESTPGFERAIASNEPEVIGILGLLTDTLLFLAMKTFADRRKRIEQRARQLQQELTAGEQRQRDLFESSPNGMLLANAEGSILMANREITKLFGYSQQALIGAPVELLMPERFRGTHSAFRQGFAQHPEMRLMNRRPILLGQRQDGSEFPLEIGLSPISHDGETLILAAINDVSERKRAEAEVAKARLLLNSTINSAVRFSIIATDTRGIITLFSAGAEEMLGYSAIEMVGHTSPVVIHLADEVNARAQQLSAELGRPVEGFAALAEVAQRDDHESREWHYVRKDGSTLLVNLTVTVLHDEQGQVIGFVGVAYDVTEEKRVAAELQAAILAAEAASQAKSDFLANMSHEIRTPMNAVLGMAHLLEGTDLSSLQREYLTMINQSGKSLLGVINDILDFSKIEAGKLDLQQIAFNLGDLTDTLSSIMSVNAASKDLELIIHVAADVPATLFGDPLRLQQVLTNLVTNAIKFTEAGEVVLQVRQLQQNAGQHLLRFAIFDTGIGISDAQRERLFAPFSQADNSMTRRFGGTGLGLVICKRLVELMGGEIGVNSSPGQGSEFWFTLPLQSQAALPAAANAPARLDALRVLVVDDHAASRQLLAEMIATFGWQAETLPSGQAALDRLTSDSRQAPPYDLLLIDMKMPGINGLQLIDTLRQLAHTSNLPLVLMATAYSREAYLQSEQAELTDAFLLKPVTSSSLFNAAIEACGKRCPQMVHSHGTRAGNKQRLKPPVHILLVEDNAMNQMVARGMLEQLGATLEIANDGAEGVDMLRTAADRFALVLMDVQMPVMDGYSATRLIRSELQLDLPVIAVSAGVTQAERDQCLACGMNDFVGKPIDAAQLLQVLGRFLTLENVASQEAPKAPPAAAKVAGDAGFRTLDLEPTLANIGGDRKLLRALLQEFEREATSLIKDVRQLLAAGQQRDAARKLHTIKGTAATLGAGELAQAAKQAELAVNDGNVEQTDDCLQRCQALLQPIITELQVLLPTLIDTPKDSSTSTQTLDATQLQQLIVSLQSSSMAAFDQFEALQGALSAQLEPSQLERLEQAIDTLDYATALAILQTMHN